MNTGVSNRYMFTEHVPKTFINIYLIMKESLYY